MACTNEPLSLATYGDITSDWVTTPITSMKGLYSPHYSNGTSIADVRGHMKTCNENIGHLDTSNVNDMRYAPLGPRSRHDGALYLWLGINPARVPLSISISPRSRPSRHNAPPPT